MSAASSRRLRARPPPGPRARRRPRGSRAQRRLERSLELRGVVALVDRPLEVRADEAPAPVDEERLRDARQVVLRADETVVVAHDRVRDAVPADEVARVAGDVVVVDAEHDDTVTAMLLPRSLECGGLGLARAAPGRPEVDDDRLSPERLQVHLSVAVQP